MTIESTRTSHAPRALLLSAALLATSASTSLATPDVDFAEWWNDDSYLLLISHMPDFDQRRGGTNGLPNGGNTHCGPTSCANLLAYIATHGFPSVDPMRADYEDVDNTSLYNRITGLIDDLGVEMRVDAWGGAGTLQNDRFQVMQDRLSAHFTVSSFRRSANHSWWPSLDDLGRAGIDNGAIMTLNYGYYNWNGNADDGFNLTQRNGGHAVALTALTAHNGRMTLGVSDSTTLPNEESTLTQSDFVMTVWSATESPVNSAINTTANACFLWDGDSESTDGANDRFLEGYLAIQPRTGLSWDQYNNEFFVLGPTLEEWLGANDPVRESGPTQRRIRDLQFDPDMLDPILLDEDTRTLVRFPVGSALPSPIHLDLEDGKIDCFAIDRHRNLYVFSDRSIRRYGFDAPNRPTFAARMPAPVTALNVHDERDEITVLMGSIGYVGTLTGMHGSRPRLSMRRLPRNQNWREASGILQVDHDTVMITMKNGGVFMFDESGRWMKQQNVEFGSIPSSRVTDVSVDDQGALLVAADGMVHAFETNDGKTFHVFANHIFHGMPCGTRFEPSRSRTNVDEHHDLNKLDEIGDRPPTWTFQRCRGDVNWDQRVDEDDVNQVLAAIGNTRGAEDLNRDGVVNVLDIVIVTSNINNCP